MLFYFTYLSLYRKIIALLSFVFVMSVVHTQTLDNEFGIQEVQKINFNKKLLKEQKIRSIQTEYMIKKELSPIVKKPEITSYYEYDNNGNHIIFYRTFLLYDTVYDTIVEYYSYGSNNQIISVIKSEYGKFGVYEYQYSGNEKVKMDHYIEENISPSKLIYIPKNRVHQEDEVYKTEKLDSLSYITYTLSADGVRYKEEEAQFENNRIKKKYSRLIFGTQKYDIQTFAYFENDLIKKEITNNYNSEVKTQFIYSYNEDKNLNSIKIFQGKGIKHLFTIEFLYNKDSKLLDAMLRKNEATGTIEITKLKYTYY